MITSTKNQKIKDIKALQNKKKARVSSGTFVIEGVRILEEALSSGMKPVLTLYTENLNERAIALVDDVRSQGLKSDEVMPHVLSAASDTENSQGVLMVFPFPELESPKEIGSVLILDQLRDPGNMGTLLRSALAADVDAVWTTPDCVDPFSPKVIRSGMGAHFRLPISNLSYNEISDNLYKHKLELFISEMEDGTTHTEANLQQASAIVVGSESVGVSEQLLSMDHIKIRIPMPGKIESLNASVAGSILLFEMVRQRTGKEN